jgi:ribonuclease HII
MNHFERVAFQRGYRWIAGVDEAGRGPLAGPVVAAAVVLPPDYLNPEINDSKKLTARKREKLYDRIKQDAISCGLGVVEASVIDRINILQATLQAMWDAVQDLSLLPDYLLIDGINKIPLAPQIPQETIIKGDSLSISVAAASIIAKVSRDMIMDLYHRQFPQYNFLKNKGYGTAEHRKAIERYGFCKVHRRSFHLKDGKTTQKTYDLFRDMTDDD